MDCHFLLYKVIYTKINVQIYKAKRKFSYNKYSNILKVNIVNFVEYLNII